MLVRPSLSICPDEADSKYVQQTTVRSSPIFCMLKDTAQAEFEQS